MDRTTLPENYLLNSGTVFEAFDSTEDILTTGTMELDTEHFKTGSAAVKVTATVEGGYATLYKEISTSFAGIQNIGVWVYIHDWTITSNFAIWLSSVTGTDDELLIKRWNQDYLRDGWNYFVASIQKDDWIVYDDEKFSNTMIRIYWLANSSSGETCSITVDDCRLNVKRIPKVLFCFDDGLTNVYDNALSIMSTAGYPASTAVIMNALTSGDPETYMTTTQIKELYDTYSWDIVNHTKTSADDIAESSVANQITEYGDTRDYLDGLGFTKSSMFAIYPSGNYSDTLIATLKSLGIVLGRSTVKGINFDPNEDIYKLRVVALGQSTVASDITQLIDVCCDVGGTLIFMLHGVVETPSRETECSVDLLQAVVNYCKEKKVQAVTFSTWYSGLKNLRRIT